MLGNAKALILVFAIAATVFQLAKPIALRFMSKEDFSRRRVVWFILSGVGLLSPNIWLYALIAAPLLIRAGRADSNAVALSLMLMHVVPPVEVTIPLFGNHGLFSLDNYRLLEFFVLLPASIQYKKKNAGERRPHLFGLMDVFLLAFGTLQVALYTPPDLPFHVVIPDSLTNILRRIFLFLLDTYLIYFAVSRLCNSREKIVDAMASFSLACALMAAVAIFERIRNWLLYVDITGRWGADPNAMYYLMRGGSVRAQVTAGHSIALGFLLAIAFGLSLYLVSHFPSRIQRLGVTLLLCGGSFASFSRGGWLGTAIIYFTFIAAGPRPASRFLRGAFLAGAVAGLIVISPVGDQVLQLLPQTGQPADMYRHRLAERGWQVVSASPFLGNQFPWPEMEDLRQGEGIIDLVNSYLEIALNYGLVGLFFLFGFYTLGMVRAYKRSRQLSQLDPDLALLGTSLFACAVGALVMIHSTSFLLGVEKIFFVLAGLTSAYTRLCSSQKP